MEKSYGIEAARGQLGEIADHARLTGQIIELTRHGRTVAVIGPADDVRPTQGVEVNLFFPHTHWPVRMATVPRKGESIEWEDPENGLGRWEVSEVEYTAHPDQVGTIGIMLKPVDADAKRQAEK